MSKSNDNSVGAMLVGFLMVAIGGTIVVVGTTVLAALIEGYVVSTVWGWVVVPTFGLPALTIPIAFMLSALIGLMAFTPSVSKVPGEDLSWGKFASNLFLRPGLVLLSGWIVKTYFM